MRLLVPPPESCRLEQFGGPLDWFMAIIFCASGSVRSSFYRISRFRFCAELVQGAIGLQA
jgi:hypothetical protein